MTLCILPTTCTYYIHVYSSIFTFHAQTGDLAPVVPPQPSLVDRHISLLHHQLGMSSSMANHLLLSQQSLIATVCRQLESLQLEERVQDHFTRLHHYQTELEQYYTDLHKACAQV